MCRMQNKHQRGFTLLEILIALFIFTILSMIMVGSLHSVINAQSGTEASAERLRKLQIALLIMSRDIEQTVNRPVLNTAGKQEGAFLGSPRGFRFTHTGVASSPNDVTRTALQRVNYYWNEDALWRASWGVLDQAPQSQPHSRILLPNVADARFQYLDNDGRFHDDWPLEEQKNQPLPRAVRVILTISNWGKISQLYVIAAQASNAMPPLPKPPPAKT